MRKLIKDVAEVISDLATLNLLDRKRVVTEIRLNPKTKKNELTVTVNVFNQEILFLCLEMFQELRSKNGHAMVVLKNDLFSNLTVQFYEQ